MKPEKVKNEEKCRSNKHVRRTASEMYVASVDQEKVREIKRTMITWIKAAVNKMRIKKKMKTRTRVISMYV